MRKKNQNLQVDLTQDGDKLTVLINGTAVGAIEEQDGVQVATYGKQVVLSPVRNQDEGLEAIIAAYNLYL